MSANSSKSEQNTKEFIEVLVFKNPLHPSYIKSKQNKTIILSQSKEILFNLFRSHSSSTSQSKILSFSESLYKNKPEVKILTNQFNIDNNEDLAFERFKKYHNSKSYSDILGDEFKEIDEYKISERPKRNSLRAGFNNLELHQDPLKDFPYLIKKLIKFIQEKTDKNSAIHETHFDLILILGVLANIKECQFNYHLKQSINKKEIFVLIQASEEDLWPYLSNMNYRLKLRNQSNSDKKFKKFSSYWEITASDNVIKEDFKNLFVRFDDKGEEVPFEAGKEGSILSFTDKFRIMNQVLNQFMDLSVLSEKRKILLERMVLHDDELAAEIHQFTGVIYTNTLPLGKIKNYFAEQVALYFAFVKVLMRFTILLALVGVVVHLIRIIHHSVDVENKSNILISYFMFSFFLIFWTFWLMKTWQRREKYLAWKWGTLKFDKKQSQRSNFKGTFGEDPVTGQMRVLSNGSLKYDLFKILNYFFTFSFISLTMISVVLTDQLKSILLLSNFSMHSTELIIGVVTTFQIYFLDFIFRSLSKKLTSLENHETIQSHNDSMIIKLFIFKFFNSYLSLFYVAFYKREHEGRCSEGSCMRELTYRLFTIFSTSILFNIIEIGHPYAKKIFKSRKGFFLHQSKFTGVEDKDLQRIEKQLILEKYDYAIKDYLEIITRIGYLILFGTAHHLFGLVVVVGLYIELKIDVVKICKLFQRQEPTKTGDIGVWKNILMFIAICGIFTNSGISVFTTGLLKARHDESGNNLGFISDDFRFDRVLVFWIVEHVFILLVLSFWNGVPEMPLVVSRGKNWGKRVGLEWVKASVDKGRTCCIENDRSSQPIMNELSLKYLDENCYR